MDYAVFCECILLYIGDDKDRGKRFRQGVGTFFQGHPAVVREDKLITLHTDCEAAIGKNIAISNMDDLLKKLKGGGSAVERAIELAFLSRVNSKYATGKISITKHALDGDLTFDDILSTYKKQAFIRLDRLQPRLTDAETEFTQENQILHYASDADNRIDVLGRDAQISELEHFLRDERRFLWLQLAGSAGQGKSRLAYDLVQRARPDFGFNAGYMNAESLAEFAEDWFDWQPVEPTLIVVDYVHEPGKRIGPAMAILAHRSKELKHPVRFLLLERQRWDRGGIRKYSPKTASTQKSGKKSASTQIMREGGTEADFELSSVYAAWFEQMELDKREFIKSSQRYEVLGKINLAAKQYQFGQDGVVELKALKPVELRELAKQIARHQNPESVIKHSDKSIESSLARFDNAGRPLYAYFLGLALADNSFQSSWDKTELLDRILTIYRKRRWSGEFADDPPELYEDHTGLHIAVAATILRALDLSKLKTWPLNQYKPGTDDKAALIINGAPRGGGIGGLSGLIPGLLPDLLGEWFVLQGLHCQPDVYERLICWCWTVDPEATASFMLRIAQDFPKESFTGELLNAVGWNETEAARNAYCEHAAAIVSAYLDADEDCPASALAALQLASDQGNARAKSALGYCHWKGYGVEKSDVVAARLWKGASNLKWPAAKRNYAICLQKGIGVEAADPKRAMELYQEAMDDGHVGARVNFAYNLERGIGVEVADPKRAMELYQEAMDDGDVGAKFNFAYNLERGIGVEVADPKRAMELYQEAIDDGADSARIPLAALTAALCLELPENGGGVHSAPLLQLANEWEDNPPIKAEWNDIPDAEAVLGKICKAAHFEREFDAFEGATVTGMRQALFSCYPDLRLVDLQISAEGADTLLVSALISATGAVLLDGTSRRFHHVNSVALNIQTDTAQEEYLRLFCTFVHADNGPFQIVTDVGDIPFSETEARSSLPERASYIATPVPFVSPQKNSHGLSATVLYGDVLLGANFVVHDTGMVDMVDDDLIAEDLAILRRRYNGITRSPLKELQFDETAHDADT